MKITCMPLEPLSRSWPCITPPQTWYNHRVWESPKTEVKLSSCGEMEACSNNEVTEREGIYFSAHLEELVDYVCGLLLSHWLYLPRYNESIHSLALPPTSVSTLLGQRLRCQDDMGLCLQLLKQHQQLFKRVHHTQLHFFNSKKIRKLLRLKLKLQNLKDTYLLDISYLNNRELLIGPVKNTEGK